MANTANANTARLDRWGRPDWAGPRHDNYDSRHDWQPRFHPGRIILIVAGFIIWWPLGLAALAYSLWSRNMGCFLTIVTPLADKMERMQQDGADAQPHEGRGLCAVERNRAFDDYGRSLRCPKKSRPSSGTP